MVHQLDAAAQARPLSICLGRAAGPDRTTQCRRYAHTFFVSHSLPPPVVTQEDVQSFEKKGYWMAPKMLEDEDIELLRKVNHPLQPQMIIKFTR